MKRNFIDIYVFAQSVFGVKNCRNDSIPHSLLFGECHQSTFISRNLFSTDKVDYVLMVCRERRVKL